MKRSTIAKTFTIAAVAVLALGLAPAAKADDKGCTNATLNGTFSHKETGVIIAGRPVRRCQRRYANLRRTWGPLRAQELDSLNGTIVPATEKGTYQVNPDCTGTYTVRDFSAGYNGPRLFRDRPSVANEIQIITTDPGTVIICVARRQFPVGD